MADVVLPPRALRFFLPALLLPLLIGPPAAAEDWVQTTDGRTLRGGVEFRDGSLAVSDGAQPVEVSAEQLATWALAHPRPERNLLRGVKVEYFNDTEWGNLIRTRMEPAMAVGHSNWPDPDIQRPDYTVRFTGRLLAPRTDTYRFFVYHNCRVSIWFDGRQLMDNGWHGHRVEVPMEAGQLVDFRIDFTPLNERADALLMWEVAGSGYSRVPAEWYFMPDDFDLADQDAHHLSRARTPAIQVDLFSGIELENWERMERHLRPALRYEGAEPWDSMSLRMQGRLRIPRTAKYTFTGRGSWGTGLLGYRLWLDEQLVLEVDPDAQKDVHTLELNLQQDQQVDVKFEFWARGRWGREARLQWAIDDGQSELIPEEHFILAPDVPRVAMVLPQARAVVNAGEIILRATAAVEQGEIERIEFVSSGEVLATATEPPYTATIRNPQRSNMRIAARAVTKAGVSFTSPSVPVTVEDVPADALEGWSRITFDSRLAYPQVEQRDQGLLITGADSQNFGESDRVSALYQRLEEDGEILVRLLEVGSSDNGGNALAGIFLRERLTDDSPFYALMVGADRAWVIRRSSAGQWPDVQWPAMRLPLWLKLSRSAGRVRALVSEDGELWREVGNASLPAAAPFYAGFTAMGLGDARGYAVAEQLQVRPRPFLPQPRPGVELVDGTFLPGRVTIGEQQIELSAGEQTETIANDRVARIFLGPVPAHLLDRQRNGATGALLRTGDFHEGEIRSLAADRVTINSLLFGPQRLRLDGVVALLLSEVRPPAGGWEVTLTDHSRLSGRALQLHADGITVRIDDEDRTIPRERVRLIRRLAQPESEPR